MVEYFQLQRRIKIRRLRESILEVDIAANPHVKDPTLRKELKMQLDKAERRLGSTIEIEKTDKAGMDRLASISRANRLRQTRRRG